MYSENEDWSSAEIPDSVRFPASLCFKYNYKSPGYGLLDSFRDVGTFDVEKCRAECLALPACEYWVIERPSYCYLKYKANPTYNNKTDDYIVSGPRHCPKRLSTYTMVYEQA